MRLGLLAVSLILAAAASARAEVRVVSTTGVLTADGRPLGPGDEVPASGVHLSNGTAILAEEGARFLLKGPAFLVPKHASFRLDFGGLLSVLKKGRKRFSVRTPTSVAAVRGTDFFVEARGKKETYICICSGKLEASAKGMGALAMSSKHHLARRFLKKGSGVKTVEGTLEGHTDAELDELRAALK